MAPHNAARTMLKLGQAHSQTTPTSGQMPPAQNPRHHMQNQMVNQQMQQRNAAIEHQMAQRRARKPTERNLPDGLEDIVIGDGVKQYNKLRDSEKRLDQIMMRKRLELQDTFSRNVKRFKTLRILVWNTCANQSWQVDVDENNITFDSIADPTYTVHIKAKLLDYVEDDITYSDSEDEDEEDNDMETEEAEKPKKPKTLKEQPSHRFSHFFKALSVEFENGGIPGDPNCTVNWKKPPNQTADNDNDIFSFTRKADENFNINICLTRDEQPERFRLSQALASTLDMEEADRAEVVMGIWEYVKFMGLQEDDERRSIRCDDALKSIFGTDTIYFPQVPERIISHLHPLPPVRLPYTVHLDEAFHTANPEPKPTIYDIQVMVEDPLRALILKMTQNPEHQAQLRQIAKLDEELAIVIQKIHLHKARHAFFSGFAKDPIGFCDKWMKSQKKDLSVILGEAEKGDVAGMELAKGGDDSVWNSDLVREAVRYRLAKADANHGQAGR
ncbi:uncharacterized protein Z518_06667 [Rhinocladiella mackenziei CBS 650.93]|uniref:DM2 domain-containing protein n=1 Tax=Rhinocladiella mackenziei CBS 650.93 TaxID=1442369 RepID=A0A0D2FMB5_9EURO|nr:uncharacterized protein Z518_06667 [Rhinocladiella mackenziei CBS 650.93]KIX03117.1 hypothetical protein Z518_06667 [Rhinocladiella mackenziei CBS 650.93]